MKLTSVVLAILLLTGCGQATASRTGTASVENVEQKTFTEEKQSETENTLLEGTRLTDVASDVFATVTGISEEWQDGLYVVNGKNSGGDKICGIMDEDGNVEIFNGYTALFPLADGNLIATSDIEVSQDCDFEGKEIEASKAGIQGVIINQDGQIVYEPEADRGLERWYPINTHQILAINVQAGWEEVTLQARMIDQNGIMTADCTSQFQYWKDYIEISEDGKLWNLKQGLRDMGAPGYIKRGQSDVRGENEVFITYLSGISKTEYKVKNWLTYVVFDEQGYVMGGSGSSDLSRQAIVYDSGTLLFGGMRGYDGLGNPIYDNWEVLPIQRRFSDHYPTFEEINARQNELPSPYDSIGYFGNIEEGDEVIPLFLECIYTDPDNSNKNNKTLYNGADGSVIEFPEKYMKKMKGHKTFGDEIFLLLQGEQDMTFGLFFKKDGIITKEAFLLEVEPDSISSVARSDNLLAYAGGNRLVMINLGNNEKKLDIEVGYPEGKIDNVEFRGNRIVLHYREFEADREMYFMYDFMGRQIAGGPGRAGE